VRWSPSPIVTISPISPNQSVPTVDDTCSSPREAYTLKNHPRKANGSSPCIVEVTVTNHTAPTQQFEQAGITWYCAGKPVFKLVKELVHGKLMIIPGRKPMPEKSVRLRLSVTADSWTAEFQPGAKGPFLEAARGKLPPPNNDQVSIQCYNGPPDAEHWIRFDDFRITPLKE